MPLQLRPAIPQYRPGTALARPCPRGGGPDLVPEQLPEEAPAAFGAQAVHDLRSTTKDRRTRRVRPRVVLGQSPRFSWGTERFWGNGKGHRCQVEFTPPFERKGTSGTVNSSTFSSRIGSVQGHKSGSNPFPQWLSTGRGRTLNCTHS